MDKVSFYKVGGCVRDQLLNRNYNDIDYAVEASSYDSMIEAIKSLGESIVYTDKTLQTVKTKNGIDYVLCRKESDYIGHKPSNVELGTLYDDMKRRDFTINALAIDSKGKIIDYFGGYTDINNRILRCINNTYFSFEEDPIRILRGFRFLVTLDHFKYDTDIDNFMNSDIVIPLIKTIPEDSIRKELDKCFKYDTMKTITCFNKYPLFMEAIFKYTHIWLLPTVKKIK
jgi:tRNA nucleotidyltransferase (CCA-adding enzyme)